jgi:MFS family permease
MGVTLDHLVAMSLPVISGYVWQNFGFRWVFFIAGIIAIIGFFVCLQIKIPKKKLKKTA